MCFETLTCGVGKIAYTHHPLLCDSLTERWLGSRFPRTRLRTTVTKLPPCWCCKGQLEPAQQLRFLVETDTLNEPAYLAQIRVLPAVNGKPVPVCKACQAQLEAGAARPVAKPAAPTLLRALGALSVGLLLSGLLSPRG